MRNTVLAEPMFCRKGWSSAPAASNRTKRLASAAPLTREKKPLTSRLPSACCGPSE